MVLANRALALVARFADPRERCEQELSFKSFWVMPDGHQRFCSPGSATDLFPARSELCRELGETSYLLPVLYGLFANHMVVVSIRRRLNWEGVLSLAEQNGDAATVVGHRMIGLPLFSLGELPAARKHLEQIVSLYDPGNTAS